MIGEQYFEQVLDLLQVQEDATLVFYDDDFGLVRVIDKRLLRRLDELMFNRLVDCFSSR